MENFEQQLSRLLFNKANEAPTPNKSLRVLLEHVHEKVLVSAHRALVSQKEFAQSELSFDGEWADEYDFPLAILSVFKNDQELFRYELTVLEAKPEQEATLSRKVNIARSGFDVENPPADFFDEDKSREEINRMSGETFVDEKAAAKYEDCWKDFHTFDVNEAVVWIQKDLYEVFDSLL